MKQTGNSIQNGSLQLFLDSAKNAARQGQCQFYTPEAVARALCRPLPAVRTEIVADLHYGSGHLATTSGAKNILGLDIDHRIKKLGAGSGEQGESSNLQSPISKLPAPTTHLLHADLTHWYPVACEVDLRLPFILINPPFSLDWYAKRLHPLAESEVDGIPEVYEKHGETIDSTLASFMIALDRLTRTGEGYMVCNANTARRFFGTPDGAIADRRSEMEDAQGPRESTSSTIHDPRSTISTHPIAAALRRYIWLWLEIPAMIFDNQMTDFPTAVLYFSRSHGSSIHNPQSSILYLKSTTGDPLEIERTLMTPEVFRAHQGSRLHYPHEIHTRHILDSWQAVAKEYAVRHDGKKPDWNIMLDEKKRLRVFLTPFQEVSRKIPRELVSRLHSLHLKTPISLCVTATSRTALREAAECGIWRIHPDVHTAIRDAMADFEAQGAPFYRPNSTQALGWVDEHSSLKCLRPGIGTCRPGERYAIACSIEPTEWKGTRINLVGDTEELKNRGKELLVTLTDGDDVKHHFHYRKDDSLAEPETGASGRITAIHWHIADLLEHFEIPIPQDIATLHPDHYQAHLDHISLIEARINANLAAAS